MTLGSSEAIKNAVAEGLGVSCLSRSVVRNLLAAKRLCVLATTLPLTGPPPSATPEPSSMMMLGTGLLAAAGMIRRRILA